MSYNTRRGGGYGGNQNNVSNIGQRRPAAVNNNFVPGGQLTPQNKPVVQMPQQKQHAPVLRPPKQATTPQQNQTSIQFRNQQQQNQTPQVKPPQTPPAPQVKTEPLTPTVQQPVVAQVAAASPLIGEDNGQEPMDTSLDGKKKPWFNKNKKITKKERQRRRNVRLSKILCPKNAVMILNELIKNVTYTVSDVPVQIDNNQYKASVQVDGNEYNGFGRSKIQAKNSAAEVALKYLVKHKRLTDFKTPEDETTAEEKMAVEGEENAALPWQHVASFALFKLFSSWGEDPSHAASQQPADGPDGRPLENKPAKKMPPNPEQMNPLMLINQMLPQAKFEEIGKSGNPPNVSFSFRCIVEGQSFVGNGPNKKAAKKIAAFGACNKVLGVTYPAEVYSSS